MSHTLTPAEVERIVDAPHPIQTVSRLSSGYNETFKLVTAADTYVVKFNTASAYETFCAERQTHSTLASHTPLPIPEIVLTDLERTPESPPYFVMEYIDGTHPPSFVTQYNPRIARQMGVMMAVLEGVSSSLTQGYGRITPPDNPREETLTGEAESWRTYYAEYIEGLLDRAADNTPPRLQEYLPPLADALTDVRTAVPDTPRAAVVLTDLRLDNLLVDGQGDVTGVFDLERADIGDAQFMLVNTAYLLGRGLEPPVKKQLEQDLLEGFVRGIPVKKKTAYQIGAIAKELHGFEVWWDECSDDEQAQQVARIETAIEEILETEPV